MNPTSPVLVLPLGQENWGVWKSGSTWFVLYTCWDWLVEMISVFTCQNWVTIQLISIITRENNFILMVVGPIGGRLLSIFHWSRVCTVTCHGRAALFCFELVCTLIRIELLNVQNCPTVNLGDGMETIPVWTQVGIGLLSFPFAHWMTESPTSSYPVWQVYTISSPFWYGPTAGDLCPWFTTPGSGQSPVVCEQSFKTTGHTTCWKTLHYKANILITWNQFINFHCLAHLCALCRTKTKVMNREPTWSVLHTWWNRLVELTSVCTFNHWVTLHFVSRVTSVHYFLSIAKWTLSWRGLPILHSIWVRAIRRCF